MTLTSAVTVQVAATEAPGRRMQDEAGGSAHEGGKFPELLGKLAAFQPKGQHTGAPTVPDDSGGGQPQTQPFRPWQLLMRDVLGASGMNGAGGETLTADADADILPAALAEAGVVAPDLDEKADAAADSDATALPVAQERENGDAAEPAALPQPNMHGAGKPADPLVVSGGVPNAVTLAAAAQGSAQPGASLEGEPLPGGRRNGVSAATTAAAAAAKASTGDAQAPIPFADGPEIVPVQQAGETDAFSNQPQDREAAAFSAHAVDARVTVVRTETHLPPVGTSVPMQQIAERLVTELASATETADAQRSPAAATTGQSPSSMPIVKVLHIQLQPADLGTVTVRMTLRQEALEVRLDVARQDAAQTLRQDRETLAKVLQSAGYAMDGVAVHVVDADLAPSIAQPSAHAQHATAQSSTQSQAGWSQPEGHASDMQRQSGHDGRRQPGFGGGAAHSPDDPSARRTPGGVYL